VPEHDANDDYVRLFLVLHYACLSRLYVV